MTPMPPPSPTQRTPRPARWRAKETHDAQPPTHGRHPVSSIVSEAPHTTSSLTVVESLGVDPATGLSTAEAQDRLSTHGPNALAEHKPRPAVLRFLDQLRSVLILVLIGAAVLAGIVGEIKDTVVIAIVLLLNASIGFFQEQRAEKSLEALRRMLAPTTRVRRDHQERVIDAKDLVPGDLVLLEAGDRVPADGRLVVAASIEVDESTLTGESQPVVKTDAAVGDVPLAERTCMLHMNTALTRGRAEMVVTATGMDTEVGQIAELLADGKEPRTPLQEQLDTLGKRLALLGGVAVSIYVAMALLRGEPASEVALRAVALAVATVPEGLPAVLALTLALGVQRMARRNAIVKRLAAVETLGSATVICSDKTGTLTLNEMTVRSLVTPDHEFVVTGQGYHPDGQVTSPDGGPGVLSEQLIDALVLCNDSRLTDDGIIGDPTEAALVVLAAKAGIDTDQLRASRPRVREIPFDADYKYMATLHEEDGATRIYVKGAADVLLNRCLPARGFGASNHEAALDALFLIAANQKIEEMGAQGLRVLALATALRPGSPTNLGGDLDGDLGGDLHDQVFDLELLGLVGIADPPRPEARDAIALCARAGVGVKMITGDHAATAAAIAAELGLQGRAITGEELAQMTPEQLAAEIDDIAVFARVAPEHKVAIVHALQERGHVVAMTGDGVNDAAALKNSHIGVAMGITGTEVTKEAGTIILTDDNFATIVGAVEEGRSIYDNVVKFVRFQLSTNVGAILTFLGSSVLGLAAPLTAIQILWVNIIMDGPPAMALGVDPARRGIMDEPPRRQDSQILSRSRLLRLVRVGAVMATGTLGVLLAARELFTAEVALTMAFTTFVLFQVVNVLNARVETHTIFTRHLFTNRWLWVSIGSVLALQIAAVHSPWLQPIFDTVGLSLGQWAICAVVALSVLLVEETVKLLPTAYGWVTGGLPSPRSRRAERARHHHEEG